jgi:hypothetical protein
MQLQARVARTEAERDAVFRHRYEVYVEELGRYAERADHAGRRLVDPEDEHSDHVFVEDDGVVVASLRMTWGGSRFSARQIADYGLAPFLAELPAELLAVGERTMISPSHRGGNLFGLLAAAAAECSGTEHTRITFGTCEPHLIGLYGRWRTLPYTDRNINHPQSGYLIPLISFNQGVEALVGQGPRAGLPQSVADAAAGTGAITCSHLIDPAHYLALVTDALAASGSALAALEPADLAKVVARSNIISCRAGDRIVRCGGTATTLYLLLDGATQCGATAGRTVGRSAALGITATRSDVVIGVDGTRVVALSEGSLGRLPQQSCRAGLALVAASTGDRVPMPV